MTNVREFVIQNLPVGIIIFDGKGTIREATDSACAILGCDGNSFEGQTFGEVFLTQEQNSEFTEVVLDAIQKEKPKIELVTPYHAPDGSRKFLSVISSAHRQKGKITEIVVIIEDLTELHEMHEREKAILDQNHKLAAERADSLIAFARSVAHQIRNPMMAIAGMARVLERHVDESAADSLSAIRDEAVKLESIVRAVSDFSAIAVDSRTEIALREIIDTARHRVASPFVSWNVDCPDEIIEANHELLVNALFEIMRNGTEFGGPKGVIDIAASVDGGFAAITVTDAGPGFDAKSLDFAFDPFYTTKPDGVGMGLTTAKRIVREHQGTIILYNGEPSGAIVTVTLPVKPL